MVFDLNAYGSTVFRQDAGLTVAGANIQYSPGLFAVVADTYSAITVGYSTGIVTAISGQYGQTLFQNRLWGTANTVIDGNGFIKTASPVVKIFSDGTFETNEESEGVKVTRKSEGVYQIKNCLGLNADGAWGGADGGFEIPVDRNKQPSVWLDYEVNADGSLLIKTFHRTHPDAPEFAQNNKEGYVNGQPVDIPATQFLSVRVQMPDNSKWNTKQAEYRERAERLHSLLSEINSLTLQYLYKSPNRSGLIKYTNRYYCNYIQYLSEQSSCHVTATYGSHSMRLCGAARSTASRSQRLTLLLSLQSVTGR